MELDLSALDKLTAATEQAETPFKGKHYRNLEAERETARRLSAAYKEYQDNIKRSGECMATISKGIQEGADLYTLLLLAMEAISKMTGNRLFYDQGKAELQAIYGALGYNAPIAHRTQEVQERLAHLNAALEMEQDEGDRDRIKRAIRAHRRRLDELAEKMTRESCHATNESCHIFHEMTVPPVKVATTPVKVATKKQQKKERSQK